MGQPIFLACFSGQTYVAEFQTHKCGHTLLGKKNKITLLSAEKEENLDVLIFKFYSTVSPRHSNILKEKVYLVY